MTGYETSKSRADSGPGFSGGAGAVAPLMSLWTGCVLLGMLLLRVRVDISNQGGGLPGKVGEEQV